MFFFSSLKDGRASLIWGVTSRAPGLMACIFISSSILPVECAAGHPFSCLTDVRVVATKFLGHWVFSCHLPATAGGRSPIAGITGVSQTASSCPGGLATVKQRHSKRLVLWDREAAGLVF